MKIINFVCTAHRVLLGSNYVIVIISEEFSRQVVSFLTVY